MQKWIPIMGLILFAGCKKPYTPPAITAPQSYLVVEGTINTGTDSTIFKLSRTVNLSAGVTTNPLQGAGVIVESDANASFPLTEIRPGYYVATNLNLDVSRKYRLNIQTTGQQYASDFVPVQVTPPIDSLGFDTLSNGVQIYVNTHDATNTNQYYRWDYQETWQFHAEYESFFISNGQKVVPRTAAQNVYSCFAGDISSNVILNSTAKLTKAVISHFPLEFIPSTSEKIETKYSILLHQYALTGDAFNFWQNLKKNTEQLGSIFDAQPSSLAGNIHNLSKPTEPVIGYVSACLVQAKRIYITKEQLPVKLEWLPAYPYDCHTDTAYYSDPRYHGANTVQEFIIDPPGLYVPINAKYSGGSISAYSITYNQCVDCTIRGTKTVPAFWK